MNNILTLKVPEKLQLYGLCVYCVVHICDFGMLRVNIIHFHPENLRIVTKLLILVQSLRRIIMQLDILKWRFDFSLKMTIEAIAPK